MVYIVRQQSFSCAASYIPASSKWNSGHRWDYTGADLGILRGGGGGGPNLTAAGSQPS